MTTLQNAAALALQAINEGWLFERIDNEIGPILRDALVQANRQPLTEQQITELLGKVSINGSYAANLVRAVEIYHGVRDD
jgi:hypothetical protein